MKKNSKKNYKSLPIPSKEDCKKFVESLRSDQKQYTILKFEEFPKQGDWNKTIYFKKRFNLICLFGLHNRVKVDNVFEYLYVCQWCREIKPCS